MSAENLESLLSTPKEVPNRTLSYNWTYALCGVSLFYLSLVAVCAVVVKDNHDEHDDFIHTARFAGLLGGLTGAISALFVILSFALSPRKRVHPNGLLFWRTVADLAIAIRFLYDPVSGVDYQHDRDCRSSSSALEFFEMSSEVWFLCVMLDLLKTLRNPFTKFPITSYHILSWGSGLIAALGMMWSEEYGVWPKTSNSEINWCWMSTGHTLDIHNFNPGSWMFLYAPLLVIYSSAFFVFARVVYSLRKGLSTTFQKRQSVIIKNSINLAVYIIFWICFTFVYWCFFTYDGNERIKGVLLFIYSSKGFVDFVASIISTEISSKNSVSDIKPEANEALAEEILFCITEGVCRTCSSNTSDSVLTETFEKNVEHIQFLTTLKTIFASPNQTSNEKTHSKVKFRSYANAQFYSLREHYSLGPDVLRKSLNRSDGDQSLQLRLNEGGASGAIFLTSRDKKLILKSCSKEEALFWIKPPKGGGGLNNAHEYVDYLKNNSGSYLARIFGVFSFELYGAIFFFMMMENIFPVGVKIHERYDIKGSWVNRNAKLPRIGKKVLCRHCGEEYEYQGPHVKGKISDKFGCSGGYRNHEPNLVFKDSDLKFILAVQNAEEVLEKLKKDSIFLARTLRTMDYSLLIGVHKTPVPIPSDEESQEPDSKTLRATVVQTPVQFHIGIIDFLQAWTFKKKGERYIKAFLFGNDLQGISAQPPEQYLERFQQTMEYLIVSPKNRSLSVILPYTGGLHERK